MANGHLGFPRNLGDPVVSSAKVPAGATGSPTPGLSGALVRRGAKRTSARGGTAKRRQRSAAGRAAGCHSALIVPAKLANGPPAGARGGKRGVGSRNPLEKHGECIEIRQPCPPNRSG